MDHIPGVRNASAGGDDVCLQLEEHAMSTACAALGVAVPHGWRAARAAHVEDITKDTPAHSVQLPTLLEWEKPSFKPLTPAEKRSRRRRVSARRRRR